MTNHEHSTSETEVKSPIDEAIIAALDGYAKDGGIWLLAKDQFTKALAEGATKKSALDLALSVASEDAECDPTVAADRFWNTFGSSEIDPPYQEAITTLTEKINTLSDLPSVYRTTDERTGVTDESTTVTNANLEYPVTVKRISKNETGEISYMIVDHRNVVRTGRTDEYKWKPGDETISVHTYGPGGLRDFILDEAKFERNLGHINNLMDISVEVGLKNKKSKIRSGLSRIANRLSRRN